MDSLTIQYIILALLFLFACFYVGRLIMKNFVPKKNGKSSGCDKNCGCS